MALTRPSFNEQCQSSNISRYETCCVKKVMALVMPTEKFHQEIWASESGAFLFHSLINNKVGRLIAPHKTMGIMRGYNKSSPPYKIASPEYLLFISCLPIDMLLHKAYIPSGMYITDR